MVLLAGAGEHLPGLPVDCSEAHFKTGRALELLWAPSHPAEGTCPQGLCLVFKCQSLRLCSTTFV